MPNDEPIPPTQDDAQPASPEIVMFFLGPDGEAVDDVATRPRTLGDLYHAWRSALAAEHDHGLDHRHRPVSRPVQGTGRPGRHGYRDEIVVTLRSRPIDAVGEALRPDLFDPPVRWLRVEPGSLRTSRYELSWGAALTVWPWQTRPARLRLFASPSLNVTVLSLFPLHPRRVATRRFLRRGLLVMNDLRDRIDERVASAPPRRAAVGSKAP